MNEYTFEIVGRERGAIGAFSRYKETVVAECRNDAELALYDTYQNIRIVSCSEVVKRGDQS